MWVEESLAIFFLKRYGCWVIVKPLLFQSFVHDEHLFVPGLEGVCHSIRCRQPLEDLWWLSVSLLRVPWEVTSPYCPLESVYFCYTSGCLISVVLAILPLASLHETMASFIITLIFLAPWELRTFSHHSIQLLGSYHISYPFFHDCTVLSPVHCCLVESAIKTFCSMLVLVFPISLISVNTQIVMYQSKVAIRPPLRPSPLPACFGPSIRLPSFLFAHLRLLAGIH